MRRRADVLCGLAALVAFCGGASGADGKPAPAKETVTVTVTGAGMDADEALRDALRKAVEEGAGTYIYSHSETRDFALVKDTILARAAGFVQSREVLARKRMEDGTWEVKVRAVVSVKGVADAWGATKILLQQMGRPRIVVFINERIGGRPVETSTVQTRIENVLLKSGFLLVDKKQIEKLGKRDDLIAQLEDNPEKLIALLRKSRAQIAITGSSNAQAGPVGSVGGVRLYPYEAEANVKVYRVDTGQLMATVPGRPTRGSGRVRLSGAKMALDLQARQVAPLVRRDVLRFWQDALGGLGELELEVAGLSPGQYFALRKQLKKIKGVKDVSGKYNKALTRMTVQADLTAEQLAEKLVEQVESLEVTDFSQNTIKARFAAEE
jgi:hypothetical protein